MSPSNNKYQTNENFYQVLSIDDEMRLTEMESIGLLFL